MKRLLRAAIPLLVLMACVAVQAEAGITLTNKVVPFRKYCATNATGAQLAYETSTGTQVAYRDSFYVSWNSTGGPAAAADTTAPFTLECMAYTPTGVGADSISLMTVSLSPVYTNSVADAADSATVTLQASWNGLDWVTGVAVDLVENNSSNTFMRHFQFARNSGATATNIQLGMLPIYRIIWADFTGSTGDYQAQVSWWRETDCAQ